MRLAVAFIIVILLGCAAWSSHQHRPFALLVDEAKAVTIVCNPVFVSDLGKRSKKVVKV